MYGGTGKDYLNGGAGDDQYVYVTGDGETVIEDYEGLSIIIVDSLSALKFEQNESGLVMTNGHTGDRLCITGYYLDGRPGSMNLNKLYFGQQGSSAAYPLDWLLEGGGDLYSSHWIHQNMDWQQLDYGQFQPLSQPIIPETALENTEMFEQVNKLITAMNSFGGHSTVGSCLEINNHSLLPQSGLGCYEIPEFK